MIFKILNNNPCNTVCTVRYKKRIEFPWDVIMKLWVVMLYTAFVKPKKLKKKLFLCRP